MSVSFPRVLTIRKGEPLPRPSPTADYLLIFGTEEFGDQGLFDRKMDVYSHGLNNITVVHGNCQTGGDRMGHEWAIRHALDVIRFPPTWHDADGNRIGNAGFDRNKRMVEWLALCRRAFAVGFWDGASAGTRSTIRYLEINRIPTKVVRF